MRRNWAIDLSMKKRYLLLVAASVLTLSAAGGLMLARSHGVWPFAGETRESEKEKRPNAADYRYVTLDKLIVMLRNPVGATRSRYLSMDLVFSVTSSSSQKEIHEQLPMLRSVAYRALSKYTVEDARRLTVDDYAAVLMSAYATAYGSPANIPFSDVLIGKLMLE
ncbi:flagellar basal body-associated FliL family protein [Caballeronia sp. dw_19]|uniref:flagellar basal body-associated FliL family protein n=2 Tax=unclassified Caballeronia TaxID=2646786 RepID=UPI001BCD00B2|nr:flagellar basal body-associated FliL family protein [Caballeronia sp. dw_19]